MVNSDSHCVRMHMARVVTTLFYCKDSDGVGSLLPRAEQEEVYEQITQMLHKAYQVSVSLGDSGIGVT